MRNLRKSDKEATRKFKLYICGRFSTGTIFLRASLLCISEASLWIPSIFLEGFIFMWALLKPTNTSVSVLRKFVVPVTHDSLVDCWCVDFLTRSASRGDYILPRSHLRCVDSSFSISAPTAWNNLPAHIRSCTSLSQFLSKLKSHLFITSFPPQ